MLKVIGVDPGLADTGIGIIKGRGWDVSDYAYGSINTPKDASTPVRLDLIFSKILKLLKDEKPNLLVVEDVFSLERYPKSGIILGKVTGVILLAGAHAGVEIIEIPVRESKKVLSGNGNATKSQLEKSVRNHLNHSSPIRPYHASDALALALIGFYRYEKMMKRA